MSDQRLLRDRLRKVRVVHEDDQILVVDKPAGLAVHGGADTKGRDLLSVLEQAYDNPPSLHLAHRLDRGTSGVLLVAKGADVASVIQGLWPSAKKRYLAAALGRIHRSLRIDDALQNKDGRSLSAVSEVVPVKASADVTLVRVDITTGRYHQIRRHLAGAGHPVLMDDKYGDFEANKRWSRAARDRGAPRAKHLLLHASTLTIAHPETGELQTFEAPVPEAWSQWLPDACDTAV